MGRHFFPHFSEGGKKRVWFLLAVRACCELHDHSTTIVRVTLPAYKSSFLQPIENCGECSGSKSHEIGKLTSSCLASSLQKVNDLHIRIRHLDSCCCCPKERCA